MALIVPPNHSSPSLDAQLGLQQAAKSTGKGVTPVQGPAGAPVNAPQSAELSISEAARGQIRSLAAAERSANDVISMAQTADGALDKMGGLLERMRELASDDEHGNLNAEGLDEARLEFSKLQNQVDGIQKSTTYEGRALLGAETIDVGFDVALDGNAADRMTATMGGLGPLTVLGSAPSSGGARRASDSMVGRIDNALAAIADQRARFGATVNRFADTAAAAQTARASRAGGNAPLADAGAAEDLANLIKGQIFGNAQPAVLTQATQLSAHAMNLLSD